MKIYFFLTSSGHIKIGKTNGSVARRKSQLEDGGAATLTPACSLQLLACVSGVSSDESALHRYFAEDNAGKAEIFEASWMLTNYIRWLRDQWFTSVDIEEDPSPPVGYDFWGPQKEREKLPPQCPLFPQNRLEFTTRIVTYDDYYTPLPIIEAARLVGGDFDLDPASHVDANRYLKARRFFSIQENGLEQPWYGKVWVNPPFSEWKRWAAKIVEESRSSRVESIQVLSAMRTVTAKYFQQLLQETSGMCIVSGRLKFNGRGTESPDDGHCVLYIGEMPEHFNAAFSGLGTVWTNART